MEFAQGARGCARGNARSYARERTWGASETLGNPEETDGENAQGTLDLGQRERTMENKGTHGEKQETSTIYDWTHGATKADMGTHDLV